MNYTGYVVCPQCSKRVRCQVELVGNTQWQIFHCSPDQLGCGARFVLRVDVLTYASVYELFAASGAKAVPAQAHEGSSSAESDAKGGKPHEQ